MWEEVTLPNGLKKHIGRMPSTGVKVISSIRDASGRAVESTFFENDGSFDAKVVYDYDEHNRVNRETTLDNNGSIRQRIVREHDEQRKPKLTSVYNADGKLIWRQERGKRPEQFE